MKSQQYMVCMFVIYLPKFCASRFVDFVRLHCKATGPELSSAKRAPVCRACDACQSVWLRGNTHRLRIGVEGLCLGRSASRLVKKSLPLYCQGLETPAAVRRCKRPAGTTSSVLHHVLWLEMQHYKYRMTIFQCSSRNSDGSHARDG